MLTYAPDVTIRRPVPRLAVLLVAALVGAAFYLSGLHRYMTLAGLQARYGELVALYQADPALVIGAFMTAQVTALALNMPGAVLSFALAGGALFGVLGGSAVVLCSLTLGDSLGFLLARYLLRDWVAARFSQQIAMVDAGVARDGAFYLLALRLMAAVPYFVVNVTMALTRMPLKVFAPVSFVGLIPATVLYVSAGQALTTLRSTGGVVPLHLLALLGAIGLLPIAARLALRRRLGG